MQQIEVFSKAGFTRAQLEEFGATVQSEEKSAVLGVRSILAIPESEVEAALAAMGHMAGVFARVLCN